MVMNKYKNFQIDDLIDYKIVKFLFNNIKNK